MGTYDFTAAEVNMIVLKNCVQHNFWVMVNDKGEAVPVEEGTYNAQVSMARCNKFGKDKNGAYPLMHWGIGGTNYCKNMQYLGSTLSRFDAHSGLYNGKVIDSTVNILALTGMGEFELKGSRLFSLDPSSTYNTILHLRADYGSVWDGEVTIKDFQAYLYKDAPFVVMSTYSNWYFGYDCAFPSIEMDNVTFYDVEEYYKSATVVPYSKGDRVYLYTGNHIVNEPQLHMSTTTKSSPYYTYVDLDGDGFVDGYKDQHGNKMVYDKEQKDNYTNGIVGVDGDLTNLNPIKPPKYIKVLNNTQGIIISLDRTDNLGVGGGFFGETKFYYAPDKYYTGTGEAKDPDDNSFKFN